MISIAQFFGEIPRIPDEKLPDGHAATASNCDLEGGDLQPIKGVASVADVGASAISIYRIDGRFLDWDDEVNVVKALVADSNERIHYTGHSYPKEINASLGSPRRLGLPQPTNALTITLNGTPGTEILHSSAYVYTVVGKWADDSVVESAPSAPTAVFEVKEGITPRLTGFTDSVGAGVYSTHYRIYRLNSGNTGAEYQYVDEIDITDTQYDDTVNEADLGEVLPTTGWTAPDNDLAGLIATSHGMVFGFMDNEVFPSPIFIPYAFPAAYSLVTESDVVGLGYTGSLVAVLTNTVPYMLIGQDPETLQLKRLGYQQKCVSSRSIVNVPGGVMYASPNGLFMLDEAGIGRLYTKKLFKKTQWEDLGPENIFAFYYDDSYIGFFSGTTSGFSIDLITGVYKSFTLSQNVYGGHYSPDDDLLYLIQTKDAIREVVSWRNGSLVDYTWYSKIYSYTHRDVFTAGMIIGDFTNGSVTLECYADQALVDTITVSDSEIFRISGMVGEKFQVRVSGKAAIEKILVGRSVPEITMAVSNG